MAFLILRQEWLESRLAFICPYETLNIFLPPEPGRPRRTLWDGDVVELFLADDWRNIRHRHVPENFGTLIFTK